LYLLGPSRRSFHPLKLLEATLLTNGSFHLLVDFRIAMVKLNFQPLFIDFFGPFYPFLTPFVIFPGLVIHLIPLLSFLLVVLVLFLFWFGNFLDGSLFGYPLVKVIFPTFCI
jgi:hypothetical protein